MKIFRTLDIPDAIKNRERERLNRERRKQQIGMSNAVKFGGKKLPRVPIEQGPDFRAEAKEIVQRAKSAGLIKTKPTLAQLRKKCVIP